MANFIDFVLDAKDDRELAMTFLLLTDANDLKVFFDQNNYDIELEDVEKIIEARKFFAEKVSVKYTTDYY